MKKVSAPEVVTALGRRRRVRSHRRSRKLGELVGAAREGLLALSVGVGLGVVHELMELEVTGVVGAKGKHDADRTAKRHGHGEPSAPTSSHSGSRPTGRRSRSGSGKAAPRT